MHSLLPEDALVTLLRRCYQSISCQAVHQCTASSPFRALPTSRSFRRGHFQHVQRRLSHHVRAIPRFEDNGIVSSETSQPTSGRTESDISDDVAIIGGGITGLTTAFYLSRELPNTNITLYESDDRVGGWFRSKVMPVDGNGHVVIEEGPKTIRPNTPAAFITLELIRLLGLESQMTIVPKYSVAAQNRFIYYPDHLVMMPSRNTTFFEGLWSALTEPVFSGVLTALPREYFAPGRSEDITDESVGSWFRRRLGTSTVGDNLVSAILHGIYAGDLEQLSIKSLQPRAWEMERRHQSMGKAMYRNMLATSIPMLYRDAMLWQESQNRASDMARYKEIGNASVFTFKFGIETLTDALEKALQSNKRVRIFKNQRITKINHIRIGTRPLRVFLADGKTRSHSRVIATIPGRKLGGIIETKNSTNSLQQIHSVTVMVVNLHFKNPHIIPGEGGFGYLIPRSVPLEQNPERALGVVFDSYVTGNTAVGTTVTVMLGGHWWDPFAYSGSYPDEEEGAAMAKAVLRRHLKIEEEPVYVNVALQRECIPQYSVGHDARMGSAHRELLQAFDGRLSVAGNSYTGVGVNDCIRAARELAAELRRVKEMNQNQGVTGLERFVEKERWVQVRQVREGSPEDTEEPLGR